MEAKTIYDEGDTLELRQINAPNIRIALDWHCQHISQAQSLTEIGRSYGAALSWLKSLKLESKGFGDDFLRIEGIIGSVAGRQFIRLSDPSIQARLDSHLGAIRSADSIRELKSSHIGKDGAKDWLDTMSASNPMRGKLKQILDSAAFHTIIYLILSGQISEQPNSI